MKKENELKIIAKQIYELEKECQSGNDIQINMRKIEYLITSLSIEEMLIIDTYITNKNFLTK